MEQSIKIELLQHIIDTITDQDLDSFEDLHHLAFNTDYYYIGYHNAEKWLESHDVSAFEAIADIIEWERNVLGEVSLSPDDMNSERVVNLYVYIKGEEVLSDFDLDQDKDDLLNDLNEALDD